MDGQAKSTDDGPNKKRRLNTLTRETSRDIEAQELDEPEFLFPTPTKRLSPLDYNVGWICALEVELAAARLMLDEEHCQLPTLSASDQNTYVLGAIGHHNIAIACLPVGVYGKSSAALAANSMAFTFTEINTYLLVGVGGGVPHSGNDIRLGDVVVGIPTPEHPAVVQYDYGKSGADGFVNKGSLDKPHQSLLTAVQTLKSSHSLKPSQMLGYMATALHKYPFAKKFNYPVEAEDILLEPGCDQHGDSCECDNMRASARPIRLDMAPRIFYGSIASGDQVIKDHRIRDRIARKHGILCFEMEAAGVMDRLHALVIRGICDYCDARKDKNFQPYAALVAAAYSKELLLQLSKRRTSRHSRETDISDEVLKHRKKIMNTLRYDTFDSRRLHVRRAHSQTCRWLLNHPDYLEWAEANQGGLSLLWLKGKPGAGKSTIMKYIHEKIASDAKENRIITAFFFNARGTEIQRSMLGLYQSLLFQLLSAIPNLQHLLDTMDTTFSSDMLIDLFRNCVNQLGPRELVCFVDALDECPEDQAWDIIRAFEDLTTALDDQTTVRVLFSSRHYPNIVIQSGKYLVLESLPGHSQDIERYVQAELSVGADLASKELREKILTRSSGVFLWVVLVVAILKKTQARGRTHELSKRLADIPPGLNDLFRDILTRDKENLSDLLFCLQWLLYARRPLKCEELYFALKTRDEGIGSVPNTTNVTIVQMADFILDCSKGLVEVTRTGPQTIEFIHESVREFLLTPGVLIELHSDFKAASAEASHRRLRDYCCRQIRGIADYIESRNMRFRFYQLQDNIGQIFPLANYSVEFVLHHANHDTKDSQMSFLQRFDDDLWREVYNLIAMSQDERFQVDHQSLDYYLCKIKAFDLLEARWTMQQIDAEKKLNIAAYLISRGALHECSLMVGAHYKSSLPGTIVTKHVEPLLEVLADIRERGSRDRTPFRVVFGIILNWYDNRRQADISEALHVAMCCKRKEAIRLLLAEGGQYNMEGVLSLVGPASATAYGTSVGWLDIHRQHTRREGDREDDTGNGTELLRDTISCITFLSDQPLLVRMNNSQMLSFLNKATEWTSSAVVEAILSILFKTKPSFPLDSALRWAVSLGRISITNLLLGRGATCGKNLLHLTTLPSMIQCLLGWGLNVDEPDTNGDTALHLAVRRGAGHAVVYLTRVGADTNKTNFRGETPAHIGARRDRPDILVRLLWKNAEPNAADEIGNTCLHEAARFQQTANIELLVHYGASVNCKNHAGRTPFQEVFQLGGTISAGSLATASLLHDHGAFISLPSSPGVHMQSTSVMSYMQMRARQQLQRRKACCRFADMTSSQIYAKFCGSTHAVISNAQDDEDEHDENMALPFGFVGILGE